MIHCRFFFPDATLKPSSLSLIANTRDTFRSRIEHFRIKRRLQIAKTCFKDFPRQTFIPFPSEPLFVFIYLLHFLSKSTLDMCEWYWERVWNQTDCFFCFPIPFHRSSHSLFHMNINILPLFRSRVPFKGVVEIHKWNIKIICLTHISFHLQWEKGRTAIIKWFFSRGKHRAMCVEILHAQENYEER